MNFKSLYYFKNEKPKNTTNLSKSRVRKQENSSFANFGFLSACAVCKCAVLCVGYSLFSFYFLSISCKFSVRFSVLLHLAVTSE